MSDDVGAFVPGTQIRIEGRHVLNDDEMLASLAEVGLRLLRWVDPQRRWLAAALL